MIGIFSVFRFIRLLISAGGLFLAGEASAQVVQGNYKLPASVDPTITTERLTELWAQVYRPPTSMPGPYPLLVFLHGNHETCGHFDPVLGVRVDDSNFYSWDGRCPSSSVVVPSHLGYNYLARDLANRGYLVVSINANRGVNGQLGTSDDFMLVQRRGRLVLRHLQELSKWNRGAEATPGTVGFSLQGLIDYSHLGLMGQGLGGEGMRSAVAQYRDAASPWPARIVTPAVFEGIFEIAPSDEDAVHNARDMPWAALVPGCIGGHSFGANAFDRMLLDTGEAAPYRKATVRVYGANNNFYNSQWQQSDNFDCSGQTPIFPELVGSEQQRMTATKFVVPFFRAHVGATKFPSLARVFDPSYPLPESATAITGYARAFTNTPRASNNFVIDNFDNPTGVSSRNVASVVAGVDYYAHGFPYTFRAGAHDATQRLARLGWSRPGGFFQTNVAEPGSSIDVGLYRALEFRVMIDCTLTICDDPADPTGAIDFTIQLVNVDGSLSTAVPLKSLAAVRRPVGAISWATTMLQTVRAPLSLFSGADLTQFRGVRFTFDRTNFAVAYFGNLRLTRAAAGPGEVPPPAAQASTPLRLSSNAVPHSVSAPETNRIVAVRRVVAPDRRSVVEIEVASSRNFATVDAAPTLSIGDKAFKLSRYASAKTDRLIFTLSAAEFAALPNGAPVSVRVGGARPWMMGSLAKR